MSESADRVDRLRAGMDEKFPESWVPEADGDELAGTLVRYDQGTAAGDQRLIAIVLTSEGTERAVWLLDTVLEDEFRRQRPKPGELLLIRYTGRKVSGAGRSYKHYQLAVDREAVQPDWDALGSERADPPDESAPAEPPSVHAPLEVEQESAPKDDDIPF